MYGLIRPEHPNLQVQVAKATRLWIQGLEFASCSNGAAQGTCRIYLRLGRFIVEGLRFRVVAVRVVSFKVLGSGLGLGLWVWRGFVCRAYAEVRVVVLTSVAHALGFSF